MNFDWSKKTHIFHLKVWALVCIFLSVALALGLLLLWYCLQFKKRRPRDRLPIALIPTISKEIAEVQPERNSGKDTQKLLPRSRRSDRQEEDELAIESGKRQELLHARDDPAGHAELSQLDWGHWFTLRDLETATNKFSKDGIIGEGGYGVVYRGRLSNGSFVAVKRLLNNLGQAEKEFRTEMEAIGHVRHKNLVRLLGYCMEGTHRLLVYEYVKNGNLEQWLHGAAMSDHGHLTWEERMKILVGTAKALAYMHEAIEPKVVHRDIKSSNILIDDEFNPKISDFGLAKFLGGGKSHIITRVMGTFGYVAPEYASSGILTEKSDVFSFGVLLLEAITGRHPVDDSLPAPEKNLVDWVKMTVGERRSEEVIDGRMVKQPPKSWFKRALLVSLRCVDPVAEQRPSMSQVVRMLEAEEDPIPRKARETARQSKNRDNNPRTNG